MPDAFATETKFLQSRWDDGEAAGLADDPLNLLRYRSNLLGADLRITNFGGGNTSSKFELPDPLTGEPVRVMAVKGSGGDLGSIGRSGFAIIYLQKIERLIGRYQGEPHEDEMVAFYPLCAFGDNRVAASIDTPLHAFLPFERLGDRARCQRQWPRESRPVQPSLFAPHCLGAVAASRVRARADAAAGRRGASRLRWRRARKPWPVHMGRDRSRLLPEQHQDDRSDGSVRQRSQGSPAKSRAGAVRRPRGHGDRRSRVDGGRNSAVSARGRLVGLARGRSFRNVG